MCVKIKNILSYENYLTSAGLLSLQLNAWEVASLTNFQFSPFEVFTFSPFQQTHSK